MSKKVQVWIGSQFVHEEPRVLIFKMIPRRGSIWQPVTGWVEKGEALLVAAKRELFEETGIDESDGKWIDLKFSHSFEGQWGKAEEHAFGLVLKSKTLSLHLDPNELEEFKWVSFEEAKKLVSFRPQRSALELFSCYFE